MNPIRCRLGLHKWVTVYFNTGFSMRVCKICKRLENKPVGIIEFGNITDPKTSLQDWIDHYSEFGIFPIIKTAQNTDYVQTNTTEERDINE